MNQPNYPTYSYGTVVPVPNSLLDDVPLLEFYVQRAFHVSFEGHHNEDDACCCGRKFETIRGVNQHIRYQNKKHPPHPIIGWSYV